MSWSQTFCCLRTDHTCIRFINMWNFCSKKLTLTYESISQDEPDLKEKWLGFVDRTNFIQCPEKSNAKNRRESNISRKIILDMI